MKKISIALAVCMGMLAVSAHAQYRDFTDASGRTIAAKLVRYDATRSKVTVDCKGKGVKTVPITVFSSEDQQYIISWSKSQDFLNERKLLVDFKRHKKKNTEYSEELSSMSSIYFDCGFEITLENRSTIDFNDVTLEYVIYYSQDKHINNKTEIEEQEGRLYEKQQMNFSKKSTKEIKTEQVILYTYRESGYSTVWPDIRSEMHGILLKLSVKTETGETITRLIKYPEKLKKSWSPSTKNVQQRT